MTDHLQLPIQYYANEEQTHFGLRVACVDRLLLFVANCHGSTAVIAVMDHPHPAFAPAVRFVFLFIVLAVEGAGYRVRTGSIDVHYPHLRHVHLSQEGLRAAAQGPPGLSLSRLYTYTPISRQCIHRPDLRRYRGAGGGKALSWAVPSGKF